VLTYSIIIPAYNEGRRIGESLDQVLAHAAREGWRCEVIVVNDGSRDNTAEIVRQHMRHSPMVRLLENPRNLGKGYSVRHGMLHAAGDVVMFTDADLSSPIQEAGKLFAALEQGADVAIGSRWLRAELQRRRQPLYRELLGRIFNLLLRLILGLNFKDTQCGFKAFNRKAAEAIFPVLRVERWGFDPEVLFLARRWGLRVAEVAVEWGHDSRSKINPLTDGFRMLLDMVRIRWTALSGGYRGAGQAKRPLEVI